MVIEQKTDIRSERLQTMLRSAIGTDLSAALNDETVTELSQMLMAGYGLSEPEALLALKTTA